MLFALVVVVFLCCFHPEVLFVRRVSRCVCFLPSGRCFSCPRLPCCLVCCCCFAVCCCSVMSLAWILFGCVACSFHSVLLWLFQPFAMHVVLNAHTQGASYFPSARTQFAYSFSPLSASFAAANLWIFAGFGTSGNAMADLW